MGNVKRLLKPLLTGEGQGAYIAPNAARLAKTLAEDLSVSEDKTSGMLKLSMESAKPKLASDLMLALIRETDGFLKERFVISGSDALQFYQQKISKARSREHREALAKLIATEEQKLMLATREGPFVVEIMMGPDQSLRPTSPKSSLVLALGLVLGLFLGAAVVLMRKAFSVRFCEKYASVQSVYSWNFNRSCVAYRAISFNQYPFVCRSSNRGRRPHPNWSGRRIFW